PAASGQAAAAPPSSVMNSRRLPRNSIRKRCGINDLPVSSILVGSAHGNSFDHLVGANQERFWQRKANRLGSFEIHDQLELGWPLDRQLARVCARENSIDVACSSLEHRRQVPAVSHEPADLRKRIEKTDRRQARL